LTRFVSFLEAERNRPAQLADFNHETLSSFLQRERKQGKRAATLLRRRATLRKLGDFLSRQGLIDGDPSGETLIKKPALSFRSESEFHPAFLQQDEIEALYKALEQKRTPRSLRDKAIIRTLLETGISIGTLVAVDLEHLDAQQGRLFVHPEGIHEGYWLELAQAFVPLQVYLREGRPNLTDSKVERALFVSQMGGRLSRQAVWQSLQNWGNKSNLKNGLTPNVVRHTAVVQMHEKGMSAIEIQRCLGHRNELSTRALLRRLNLKASK